MRGGGGKVLAMFLNAFLKPYPFFFTLAIFHEKVRDYD